MNIFNQSIDIFIAQFDQIMINPNTNNLTNDMNSFNDHEINKLNDKSRMIILIINNDFVQSIKTFEFSTKQLIFVFSS